MKRNRYASSLLYGHVRAVSNAIFVETTVIQKKEISIHTTWSMCKCLRVRVWLYNHRRPSDSFIYPYIHLSYSHNKSHALNALINIFLNEANSKKFKQKNNNFLLHFQLFLKKFYYFK